MCSSDLTSQQPRDPVAIAGNERLIETELVLQRGDRSGIRADAENGARRVARQNLNRKERDDARRQQREAEAEGAANQERRHERCGELAALAGEEEAVGDRDQNRVHATIGANLVVEGTDRLGVCILHLRIGDAAAP